MWSFGTTMTMAHDDKKAPAAPPKSSSPQPPGSPSNAENKEQNQNEGQIQSQISTAQPNITPQDVSTRTRPPIFSERSLRQLGLFFAGAGFLSLSTLITRRSIARKRRATIPSFYHPSNRSVDKRGSDSSLIALEALNLATLNVMGFGIMCTGGLAWAFDISNVDDLRKRARGHIGPPGGYTDEEAEREVEEWVAKVLHLKEKREGGEEEKADSSSRKGS